MSSHGLLSFKTMQKAKGKIDREILTEGIIKFARGLRRYGERCIAVLMKNAGLRSIP